MSRIVHIGGLGRIGQGNLLISDQRLVDELADLAARVAADLMVGAAEGKPGCERAANSWLRLAMSLGSPDTDLQPAG